MQTCARLALAWTLAALALPQPAAAFDITGPLYLSGVVRDFCVGAQPPAGCTPHPDFGFSVDLAVLPGAVASQLSPNQTPMLNNPPLRYDFNGAANFTRWFAAVPGYESRQMVYSILLAETAPGSGIFEFASDAFYPADDMLWGNQGDWHNRNFTFALHSYFVYQPGRRLDFVSDDDLWVFVNNRLVVDLGGVHAVASAGLALDSLGLAPGQVFSFDLFYAQRSMRGSALHVRYDSNITPDVYKRQGWPSC